MGVLRGLIAQHGKKGKEGDDDKYHLKTEDYLDASDLRKTEVHVIRGTLGNDLLGAFSNL